MGAPEGIVRFVDKAYGLLSSISYYRLLNIKPTASIPEIKKAYYKIASKLHPDLYGKQLDADFKMRLTAVYSRVAEAYKVLSDARRRKLYDEQLAKGEVRLTLDAEAKPKLDRPEDKIANPNAKKFYLLGMKSIRSGDAKSGILNLKFALSAEPTSEVIKEALAKAEEK